MNKYLEQLVELSKYDGKISSYEPKIELENSRLTYYIQTQEGISQTIETIQNEVEELKQKSFKNNAHLAELKTKHDDIVKKNSSIQNEKELKALQLEEEINKEQLTFANEEIIRIESLLSSKEENLKELQEKLENEIEQSKDVKIAVDTAVEQLNVERNDIYTQRAQLLERLDSKILIYYEKIRRWAKDSAVVNVRKQACSGCNMKISDKFYADVIKAEEIVGCPHCGRILYKEQDEVEVEKEA